MEKIHSCFQSSALFFQYFHDGSDTLVDQLTLVARTRTKTSVPASLLIRIIPVNDETPKLVNNTELEVWAGSYTILTNRILGECILQGLISQTILPT